MNQIDIPDSSMDCNAKRNGPRNFPRKKFVFHTEMSTFRYSLLFSKKKLGSRSCSNQTKLGMENPLRN